MLLLPQDLQWVPEGHLAHHVSDRGRLGSVLAVQRGDSPYDPRSTRMGRAPSRLGRWRGSHCVSDAGGGQLSAAPDAVRPSEGAVFAEVVARGMGLVGFGRVSVDGRSGEREQAQGVSYGRMVKEERRPSGDSLFEAVDEAEDAFARGTSCRRSSSGARTGWRRSGRRRRAWRPSRWTTRGAATVKPYKPVSRTRRRRATSRDPAVHEARSEGFQQCYNAQTVVDGDNQVVVATTVTDSASDQGQLIPFDAVRDAFGETRSRCWHAGYCSEPNRGPESVTSTPLDGTLWSLVRGRARLVRDLLSGQVPAKARMAKKLGADVKRAGTARRKCDGRGACRLDQGGDGISTIQLPGLGEGPGRMGPGQRQAAAHPPGRLRMASVGLPVLAHPGALLSFCGADS